MSEWNLRVPGGVTSVALGPDEQVVLRALVMGVGTDVRLTADQAFELAAQLAGLARSIKYRKAQVA